MFATTLARFLPGRVSQRPQPRHSLLARRRKPTDIPSRFISNFRLRYSQPKSITNMETLLTQVKQLAESAGEAARLKLIDQLKELTYSLEKDDDIMQRVMYRQLEIAMIRLGEDLKLFELLAESETPLTVAQLSEKTSAAPLLLGRVLRYLAAMKLIKETGRDEFAATNITTTLALPANAAGVYHQFNLVGPMWAGLPNHLEKTKYQDMNDRNYTCWHSSNNTEEHIFSWMGQHPEVAQNFGKWIKKYMTGQKTWLDSFPLEKEVGDWKPQGEEDVLLVDVGGNVGPLLDTLVTKAAPTKGRIILQEVPKGTNIRSGKDQPHDTDEKQAVERTVHDINTPQPVKNAKFYYIRSVFHDFSDDEKCRTILSNIIPAMGKDSVILIDEKIFPDTNVNWKMSQIDISMMACFASIERTETMWATLLDSVGLKIASKHLYQPEFYDGVLVVERK